MSDGGPRKRSADTGEGDAEGGQAAEGSVAKRPKPDAPDAASAYAAAIQLVRSGEFRIDPFRIHIGLLCP
jgi:hypothetical protein